MSAAPIGIFDSGVGGLTVAAAVRRLLPNESIVYFGDTAHFPYGDKSVAAIQSYSVKIADVLLQQQCKMILIACNSASSAAYQLVREYVGKKALVLNVIDPVVQYLGTHYAGKRIGLIGTKRTVASGIYRKKVDKLEVGIDLRSLATPLLAPMIEEGFYNHTISRSIIQNYLQDVVLEEIAGLVLACTHYPLIKEEVAECLGANIPVIDGSEMVAQAVLQELSLSGKENKGARTTDAFYISDFTKSFAESARIFFGTELEVQAYPVWD
jgi:glutamate racemase